MTTHGICATCGFAYELSDGGLPRHLANPDMRRNTPMGPDCTSFDTWPTRNITAGQAKVHNRKWINVVRVREEAAVTLDAVVEARHDMDHRLWVLLNHALSAYRLIHPQSRFTASFKWWPRSTRSELYKRKYGKEMTRGDVFCIFCGELLLANLSRESFAILRQLAKTPSEERALLRDRVYQHTTPCGLQCLAGMKPYAAPDVRKLPATATEEAA